MLNSVWLDTFVTLCETGHFTRAAQRIGMTQPGVSQHLRKLEAQVGHPLIIQQGKAFALTAAGEAVLNLGHIRREQERQLHQSIQIDDPDQGDVRITCSGSFALSLSPLLLPLMQQAPALMVHLEAAPQATVLNGLKQGHFDLGILDHDPAHPRLAAEYLGQEELCLVVPASWPDDVNYADLQRAGFIGHPDGFAYADDLFALNFPKEFSGADGLHIRGFVNQIGQIPTPVAHEVGYTLLPRSGIAAHPDRAKLQVARLARQRYHQLWLVWRKDRPIPARMQVVAGIIRQVAQSLE
jgi:DNA-binding transcriptional LysR family regulator